MGAPLLTPRAIVGSRQKGTFVIGKDPTLAFIAGMGAGGGTNWILEFAGNGVQSPSRYERLGLPSSSGRATLGSKIQVGTQMKGR